MSPKIGQQDEFEGLYTEKFRSLARPFGEFVKYERDRAALDAGIHLTTKTSSKFRNVSNTRVWFQLKGIQATTLLLADYDKASEITLDLPIDDLRFWYASPEAVYLVVYVEAVDHFLAEDIKDIIDRQWGEEIFNPSTFKPSKNTPEFELERSQFLTMHCGTECSLTNLYESMVPHFGGARWGIVSTPCVACQRRSSLQYSKNSYSVF